MKTKLILAVVLGFSVIGFSLSGCSHSMTEADLNPQLAEDHGYFVSVDEARERGGVGNYVPRPSAHLSKRTQVIRDQARAANASPDANVNSPVSERTASDTTSAADAATHTVQRMQELSAKLQEDLLFDTNVATIKSSARGDLDELSQLLSQDRARKIHLAGYADSQGTEPYNLKLSQRRASSVKNYLLRRGVQSTQISMVGFGEAKPVATNRTESGRSLNRRVEIRIGGGPTG